MPTIVRYEVRWVTYGSGTRPRDHRKVFDRIEDAKTFKDTQNEKHPWRYTVVKITTEEVA